MTNYEHEVRRPTGYNDGQIHGWNGGECPLHPETEVQVWFRYSTTDTDLAKVFVCWEHDDEDYDDIIAFRVVKEHHEPKVIWVNEYSDGSGYSYTTKEGAQEGASDSATRIAVKYQEVIE